MLVNLLRTLPLVGFLILQCLASLNLKAQGTIDTTGMRQQVKQEAELFLKAGLSGEFNSIIKHYHPEQVEALGGEKNLLKELKAANRLIDKVGFSSAKFSVALPEELLLEDDAIQCAFRYTLNLPKTGSSEAQVHQSTIIAVSENAGKDWYFLDVQNLPLDRLLMIFSFINPNLNLPVDPAVQTQINGIAWELQPFIKGKNVLEFNRKTQRIIFSVSEGLLTERQGLISTQGKMLLKPDLMSVEDRDSLIYIHSEDNIEGALIKPGQWDQLLPLPDQLEDIYSLRDRQRQSQISGLHFSKVGENQYRIENTDGKRIAQLELDEAPRFTKQFIYYYQNGRAGLMNLQGMVLIKPEKFGSLDLNEDIVQLIPAKLASTDEYILIDTLGNQIGKNEGISHMEQRSGVPYFSISKEVKGETQYGLMDFSGKIIVQALHPSPLFLNRVAYALPKGERWELKSIQDHQSLLDGRIFDDIDFSEEYIIVSDSDKEILELYSNDLVKKLSLNLEDIVLQPEVLQINGKEILLLDTMRGKLGYDLEGKPLFSDVKFKDVTPLGLIFIQNGKMGLITIEGKTLIPAALDDIDYLEDSQSLWGKTNGKWGLLKL